MSVPSFATPVYILHLATVHVCQFLRIRRETQALVVHRSRAESHTFQMDHISFNCCQEFNKLQHSHA